MKKIFLLLMIITCSGIVSAQSEGNAFNRSFNNQNSDAGSAAELEGDPGSGGLGGDDAAAAPIDDYIPALAILGLGMAAYFGRKKLVIAK